MIFASKMLAKVIYLFALVNFMYCAPKEDFQTACAVEDFQCNSEASENFLEKTATGDSALGIEPYDPLIIDSFTSNNLDGVVIECNNINVTGLRKQNVTEFKVDKEAKSINYAVTVDVNIDFDVVSEYVETKKKYSGTFTASGKAAVRSTYNYQLKSDDKGVEYFESGPETTTCDFITYRYDTSKELLDAIAKDPHANKVYQENIAGTDTVYKAISCDILKLAYGAVVDAARKVERAYPASAFFSDV